MVMYEDAHGVENFLERAFSSMRKLGKQLQKRLFHDTLDRVICPVLL